MSKHNHHASDCAELPPYPCKTVRPPASRSATPPVFRPLRPLQVEVLHEDNSLLPNWSLHPGGGLSSVAFSPRQFLSWKSKVASWSDVENWLVAEYGDTPVFGS
jgi:hypothetical protein